MTLQQLVSAMRRSPSPGWFIKGVARWFFRFDWINAGDGVLVVRNDDGVTIGADMPGLVNRLRAVSSLREGLLDWPFLGRLTGGNIQINAGNVYSHQGGAASVSEYNAATQASKFYYVKLTVAHDGSATTVTSTIQVAASAPDYKDASADPTVICVLIGVTDADGKWTQKWGGGDIYVEEEDLILHPAGRPLFRVSYDATEEQWTVKNNALKYTSAGNDGYGGLGYAYSSGVAKDGITWVFDEQASAFTVTIGWNPLTNGGSGTPLWASTTASVGADSATNNAERPWIPSAICALTFNADGTWSESWNQNVDAVFTDDFQWQYVEASRVLAYTTVLFEGAEPSTFDGVTIPVSSSNASVYLGLADWSDADPALALATTGFDTYREVARITTDASGRVTGFVDLTKRYSLPFRGITGTQAVITSVSVDGSGHVTATTSATLKYRNGMIYEVS